jgi:hypothetical protein
MAISDAANGMANVKTQAYVVAFGTVQPGHLIQGD